MPEFIFASGNQHKVEEVRAILAPFASVLSLKDLGFDADIPETGSSLEENAWIKANTIFQKFGKPVIADDTGLMVTALDGEPGVYSARYAGENASFEDNCKLLLQNLDAVTDRSAVFKTVICFINAEQEVHYFQGEIEGEILHAFRGDNGFGYDPIFKPLGSERSFAQMSAEEKNQNSHRSLALQAFYHYLKSIAEAGQ